MRKFLILLICGHSLVSWSAVGFDSNGARIPQEIFNQFEFPEDLVKTNLTITPSSPENPFEWAGRIQTKLLDGWTSPCSAGVVALPGYKPQDYALVLTAGHCVHDAGVYLKPHQVLVNHDLANYEIYFDFPRTRKIKNKIGTIEERGSLSFKRILFASFDVVDLALIEMELTYEQLDYRDQKPPLLVQSNYSQNQKISVFGIPYEETYTSYFFHMASCRTKEVYTDEAIYRSISEDIYNVTERVSMNCTVFAGMSGGYVRNHLGQVIGVLSGGFNDGDPFYAGVSPLMTCATNNGKLDTKCLNKLKKKIESWKTQEIHAK